MSGSQVIGIGVAGCGWAGRELAKHVAALPGARLVGFCDPNETVVRQTAAEFGVQGWTDFDALLAAPDIAAVVLGSPQFMHHPQTLAALAAGKHVFTEKPMALSVADCDEMIAAARAADRKLCVGQVLRLIPHYAKMAALIGEEHLGAPLAVAMVRCGGRPVQFLPDGWRRYGKNCGGVLFEINVHELDFMRCLCGEPTQVYAHAAQVASADIVDYPDLWQVQVTFASGAAGTLRAGFGDYLRHQHQVIYCPRGTISTDNETATIRLKKADGAERVCGADELAGMENGYRWEVRSWLDAIQHDTPMVVDAWDGRQAVAMAEAANQSAASGAPCAIPPAQA